MATRHTEVTETRKITVLYASVLPAFGLNPADWVSVDGTDSVTVTVVSAAPDVRDEDV